MPTFEVVVENVGLVHEGVDYDRAKTVYDHYVEMSQARVGRCDGSSVMLMADGRIIRDYLGESTDE